MNAEPGSDPESADDEAAASDFARFRLSHVGVRKLAVALATYETPADREIYLSGIFDRLKMRTPVDAVLAVGSLRNVSIDLTRILDQVRAASPEASTLVDEVVRRMALEAAVVDE